MKKIFIIIGMIFMFILGSCAVTTDSAESVEQTWPLKIWEQNKNSNLKTWNLKDEKTGVEYIVVSSSHYHGGTCIVPRYNTDGTLYTGE